MKPEPNDLRPTFARNMHSQTLGNYDVGDGSRRASLLLRGAAAKLFGPPIRLGRREESSHFQRKCELHRLGWVFWCQNRRHPRHWENGVGNIQAVKQVKFAQIRSVSQSVECARGHDYASSSHYVYDNKDGYRNLSRAP
jgi:hypothetical protein